MKDVRFEDDGVASVIGAILAILIFIFLLSLFVTNYVPAEMTSYEEKYSSAVANEMMQFVSSISLLSLNYKVGETVSVTFDLQSNYISLFSSPTTGELSLSSATQGSSGYLGLSNSTVNISAGGSLSVVTNNRYFVDEGFSYQFSNLYYEQYGSNPFINTTLQFNLIRVAPSANGSMILFVNLINLMGGPINMSSQTPFIVTCTAISESTHLLKGNVTMIYTSPFGYQLFKSLSEMLSSLNGIGVSQVIKGGETGEIFINGDSVPIILNVTELNVLVGINSS